MIALTKITARDFGSALKAAREEAHATLEAMSERTKISTRMLAALEAGEFGKLPNLVFAKMFTRQYLEFIGERPELWLQAFDAAWRKSADSSQPFAILPAAPVRRRRVGPWLVGSALVGAGIVGVILVENRQRSVNPPTLVALATPAPRPTAAAAPGSVAQEPAAGGPQPAAAAQQPAARPDTLTIKTGESSCWVEVRVAGESPASKLLAAGAVWEVAAAGRDVDLVLGDAGAASVEYLGQARNPAGRPGEVAHLHLQGSSGPPAQR